MAISRIEDGQLICQAGDALKELYVIGEGTVRAAFPGGDLMLRKGDIIGIQDIQSGVHSCTYTAAEETALILYPFTGIRQLLTLFQNNPKVMHLFFTSSARFSSSLLKYCAALDRQEESGEPTADEPETGDADDEKVLSETEELQQKEMEQQEPEQEKPDDIRETSEEPLDDFTEDTSPDSITAGIPPIAEDSQIPPELADALPVILSYGDCGEELSQRFLKEIAAYKAMPDKDSTQDADRAFRSTLAADFYQVYAKVFEATLDRQDMPQAVRLFLTFGFVDAELAGAGNSAWLFSLGDACHGDPQRGIYTLPEWLTAIYEGRKEPSRNEFDLDYPAWLREQKTSGNINAQQEKELLDSAIDKVRFEMQNVFPIANKMTFGRISTFCPVLSAHNMIKPLPDCIVTPHRLTGILNKIRKVDFTAFYRETVYVNEECGVTREYVDIEVLPDIILMPNVGIRGAMWQEIEGKRRTTPARMMLSAIALESVTQLMIRMTGEFRWEMCKRIQGAYWNNIAERSLTSEYTDYAQFYKKNHELSPDAKEKIRLSLQKAKNSIKEMFVRDYISWIGFESKGSPRLNKIARTILFTYCPFSVSIRESLQQHPLYRDMIDRYRLILNQKQHHLDMLCTKIEKGGFSVPEEIKHQKEFLKS